MGGPMGVSDEKSQPFLFREKEFIRGAIYAGKRILGICLGAQLIASVVGAKVLQNKYLEIGWHKLKRIKDSSQTILDDILPVEIEAFHWHGDTFMLPENAIPLFKSEACENQAFIIDDRIIGFQFHLETTAISAAELIDHCRHELDGSQYVQSEKEMLSDKSKFVSANRLMDAILTKLCEETTNSLG